MSEDTQSPSQKLYASRKIEIIEAATKVRADLSSNARSTFDNLVSTACGHTGAQADKQDGQKQTLADIKSIITFTESI